MPQRLRERLEIDCKTGCNIPALSRVTRGGRLDTEPIEDERLKRSALYHCAAIKAVIEIRQYKFDKILKFK